MSVPAKKFSLKTILCPSAIGFLMMVSLTALSSAANHSVSQSAAIQSKNGKPVLSRQIISPLKRDVNLLISPAAPPPPDITIDQCGTSVTLNTTHVTGYSNPTWDDGTTGTSRTVTASGTYWWQVTGANVVENGDFSAGNTDFSSQYTYMDRNSTCDDCCCGALSSEGTYGISRSPANLHSMFTDFGDHTGNNGRMLIVNGSATANVVVWKEDIPIIPNTNYVFSAWATSAHPDNPANLQFSINGSLLGVITLTSANAGGQWQFFTTTWNSGSLSGNVPIALVNQNIIANGNDFAIDDIVFAPVYRQNIIVNLNPIPVLTLSPGEACGQYNLTQSIIGYDPVTYDYTFKDHFGNVITAANAMAITSSGVYTITEQNKLTTCQSLPKQTTVTINPDPQKPGISSL